MCALLSARSASMRRARSCSRVRRRLGIMSPRSPGGRRTSGTDGRSPVGRQSLGNSRRLPGQVAYFCPVGEVQMTVPSDRCSSRQPLVPAQNVLSKWWHRLAKEHFTATVGPVAMSDLADLLRLPQCSRRRAMRATATCASRIARRVKVRATSSPGGWGQAAAGPTEPRLGLVRHSAKRCTPSPVAPPSAVERQSSRGRVRPVAARRAGTREMALRGNRLSRR
jgi:hypothetical protein